MTNSYIRRGVVVACALAAVAAAGGQQDTSDLAPDVVAQIDAIVDRERLRLKIPGLTIAIAIGGRLRYEKGFGLADLESRSPSRRARVSGRPRLPSRSPQPP